MIVDIHRTSCLQATRDDIWAWMTSLDGISTEMRPYFRMTAPDGVRRLDDLKVELGSPLFRSQVLLFGFLPAGSWDFTLVDMQEKEGFVEESPSTFMKQWRHERRIADVPGDASSVMISDHVTFSPRAGRFLVGPFIGQVFRHRHRVLRERFHGSQP
jgi:ligand-binding SRPBCC domain-containing protein